MKRLALCADDFGLSPAIDRGILSLARRQRLTHVSCIVNADGGPEAAAALRATGVGLGLHLNLTEGRPLSPALVTHWPALPSLPRLIVMAHLGRLPLAAIGDELQRQVMAFKAAFGQAPTHLDGHQHVHHLPGVRTLVLDLLAQRPGMRVRHTGRSVGPGAMLKRSLLAATGGRVLGQHLGASGQGQNRVLAGLYDFKHTDYRGLMQAWLAALPAEGGLILCHPGEAIATPHASADPIAAARMRELAYLGSGAFTADLLAAAAVLYPPVPTQSSSPG